MSSTDLTFLDRATGCLLGGAVGDALGGPVEFLPLNDIRSRYGPAGVLGFDQYRREGNRELGWITDDTQMTLFTAEGLLRASGPADVLNQVHQAYLRWLYTQGERPARAVRLDGWLITLPELHHRRAPGNTCLSALRSGTLGTIASPINTSKGCGGVMRAAPAGLRSLGGDPFQLGMEVCAITHGHPSGYLAGGCLAQMVHDLATGSSLQNAIDHALDRLRQQPDPGECLAALEAALRQARTGAPSAEQVERLGGGWVAEEALAISVYCALVAGDDFACGVRLAVNHSGDSDSTGAITGNLLGTLLGRAAIPADWLAAVELRREIEQVGMDLAAGSSQDPTWSDRYPA